MLLTPNVGVIAMFNSILSKAGAVTEPLTLRLFSNNKTPAIADVVGDYTEVSGGGYAAIALSPANWTVTGGAPNVSVYNAFQDFTFTGVTGAPGTVYGYYITDANNVVLWAERFSAEVVPFTPENGSLIRIKPRITGAPETV